MDMHLPPLLALAESTEIMLVILVFLGAVLFGFRKEIRQQIPRLTSASAEGGPVKMSLDLAPPAARDQPSTATPAEGAQDKELSAGDDGGASQADTDEDSGSTLDALLAAGRRKDRVEFDRLAARYADEAADDEERRRAPIRVLGFRYFTGLDQKALDALEARASSSPQDAAFAQNILGLCHNHSGNLAAAEHAFREGLRAAEGRDRRFLLANLTDTLLKAGRASDARNMLEEELRAGWASGDNEKALWEKLADVGDDMLDFTLAAAATEKATALAANDSGMHFSAGYAYGQTPGTRLSSAAVHHYKMALDFDPRTDYADNNMAIQLAEMNMPISAVTRYRAEVDRGDSLAMANLAQRYFQAGFADEADELLCRAEQDEDPDPRVAAMRSALNDARKRELEAFNQALRQGQKQAEFMRRWAEALVGHPLETADGAWTGRSDTAVDIDGTTVTITWRYAGRREWYELVRRGNALEGTRWKEDYYGSPQKESVAYGLVEDSSTVRVMSWSPDDLTFDTFRAAGR